MPNNFVPEILPELSDGDRLRAVSIGVLIALRLLPRVSSPG